MPGEEEEVERDESGTIFESRVQSLVQKADNLRFKPSPDVGDTIIKLSEFFQNIYLQWHGLVGIWITQSHKATFPATCDLELADIPEHKKRICIIRTCIVLGLQGDAREILEDMICNEYTVSQTLKHIVSRYGAGQDDGGIALNKLQQLSLQSLGDRGLQRDFKRASRLYRSTAGVELPEEQQRQLLLRAISHRDGNAPECLSQLYQKPTTERHSITSMFNIISIAVTTTRTALARSGTPLMFDNERDALSTQALIAMQHQSGCITCPSCNGTGKVSMSTKQTSGGGRPPQPAGRPYYCD